jgi:hypothetical protein
MLRYATDKTNKRSIVLSTTTTMALHIVFTRPGILRLDVDIEVRFFLESNKPQSYENVRTVLLRRSFQNRGCYELQNSTQPWSKCLG